MSSPYSLATDRASIARGRASMHAGLVIFGIDSLWVFAMAVWSLFEADAVIALIGAAIAWVSVLPVCMREYRFLSPWTMLAFTLHLGGLVRSFYVLIAPEFALGDVDSLFLLGHEPRWFIVGAISYLAGITLTTLVYILYKPKARTSSETFLGRLEFRKSIFLPTVVFAGIGLAGLLLYVQATGGFSLEDLSSKRSAIDGLDVGEEYSSHGVLRFLNSFGQIALWCYVGKTVSDNRNFSYVSIRGAFVGLLALNAVALPFYSSSRAGVAFILAVAVAVDIGVRRRMPSILAVGVGVIGTLLTLVVMTLLRGNDEASLGASEDLLLGLQDLLVLNRNFGDFFTLSHILDAVPVPLEWARGSTIAGYIVAPIPRSVWPEKPLISVGPTIGYYVYGNERSGVPPGWFGEWYWNFGILGFIVGAIGLGLVLKYLAASISGVNYRNTVLVVIFAVAFFRLGYFALGGGIGSSIFKSLVQLGTVVIFLVFAVKILPARSKSELTSTS